MARRKSVFASDTGRVSLALRGRINERMRERNIDVRSLAEASGLSCADVRAWIGGKYIVTQEQGDKLFDRLGMCP